MAQGDVDGNTEQASFGAPDLGRLENELRQTIEAELPFLTPEAREAVLQSRLKILSNATPAKLIKVDLGEDASKKVKENLFE